MTGKTLKLKVPPRFELGSLDSKSRVLTITPWNPMLQGQDTLADQNMSAPFVWCVQAKKKYCFLPGSNRRPCACEAHVITATLRKLDILASTSDSSISQSSWRKKKSSSHLGVEPRTFGLEVQRAIHCANGTQDTLVAQYGSFPECRDGKYKD